MNKRGWLSLALGVLVVAAAFAVWGLVDSDEQPDAVRVDSVSDLADRLGCSSFDKEPEPGPVAQVAEGGTCVLADKNVTISFFASTDDRDEWAEQVAGLAKTAGFDSRALVGENWAVQAETTDELEVVQKRLGGELVQ